MRVYVDLTGRPVLAGYDVAKVFAPLSALQHVLAVGIYKGSMPLVHVPVALVRHMASVQQHEKTSKDQVWLDMFSSFVPSIPVASATNKDHQVRIAFVMRPEGALQRNITQRRRFKFKLYDAECEAAGGYTPNAFAYIRESVYVFVPPPLRLHLTRARHPAGFALPPEQPRSAPSLGHVVEAPRRSSLDKDSSGRHDTSARFDGNTALDAVERQRVSQPLTFIAAMAMQPRLAGSRNTSAALYTASNV